MLHRILLFAVLIGLAVPAHAEKMTFDHRLVPHLKAMLDSGRTDLIDYNASNPKYVVDRIVVRGKSVRDWNEVLEIVARTPDKKVRKAADWLGELHQREGCRTPAKIIAEDAISVTVERAPGECGSAARTRALFRIVAGKRSMFLLAVHQKGAMDPAEREQWLALLASAHLD